MSQIYLTSDLHLRHRLVQHLRGFVDDAEQIESLRASWSRVTKRDIVYVLGDVSLGRNSSALEIMASLPGTKRLISGNHDATFPSNHAAHTSMARYMRAFESVDVSGSLKFAGTTFLLSHFPYDGEGDVRANLPERYTQWRLRDLGVPLIHGHTHTPTQFSRSALGTPQYHIGLDAWPSLAPMAEVYEMYRTTTEGDQL